MQGYTNSRRLYKWGRRREAIDEASLIDQILKGDHAKFREIIDRYGRHVYQVTYSVLHQAQDAEDAAQEAFIQVFKSLPSTDPKDSRHGLPALLYIRQLI